MSKRSVYLAALHNQKTDELVWAPNFDYWYQVNRAEKTLPPQYEGMSRNEIVHAVGGSLWNRASGLKSVLDESVTFREYWKGTDQILEYTTPVGTVYQTLSVTEGVHRARATTHHMLQEHGDIRILKYIAEATHFEPDYESTQRALEETGEEGVVLNSYFCVPFIQFAKTDMGYADAFYLWSDYKEDVDELIAAYFKQFLDGYRILAGGPADIIATGDNMDGVMISPAIFEEYALPFYAEAKKITQAAGKLLEVHWCGRTDNLLHYLPDSGVDVVEAVVTKPMSGITVEQALERLDGKVVMQGGIPSVMVCREGCSEADFERYLEETILPLKGRPGYIVGMSDNVPPNADFSRVERIAQILR